MATETVTRRTLRSLIAEAVVDKIVEGTATAGGASTLDDTANLLFTNDDALNGAWIFIHTGTSSGDERGISDFTAASDRITVASAWTTTPSTDSQYEVHRRWRVADYNNAINAALRATRISHLGRKRDVSLLTNSNLLNPLFTNMTSGAADDWSTSSQRRQQAVINVANLKGNTVTIEAVVYSVSTDVQLEVDDGVATAQTVNHDGSGWNVLRITHTISDSATALTISILDENAASISSLDAETSIRLRGPRSQKITWNTGTIAYVDSVFCPDPAAVLDYTIPSGFNTVHLVQLDRGSPAASAPVEQERAIDLPVVRWRVTSGNTSPASLLRLERVYLDNRAITVWGMGVSDIPTADTDALDVNVEILRLYAASVLLRSTDPQEARMLMDQYLQLKAETRIVYPENSRYVDVA